MGPATMIALDTNVLVRYLVDDDAEQAKAARALLEGLTSERPGFVCREVAIEVVWVLERAYRFRPAQIADVLVELIATDSIVVEAADDVARAAFSYRQGGVGFSDLMILSAVARVGAAPLHTFDRRLARIDGAVLVENYGNGIATSSSTGKSYAAGVIHSPCRAKVVNDLPARMRAAARLDRHRRSAPCERGC